MHIELTQQIGWKQSRHGTPIKEVFNVDKVYRLNDDGNRVEYLGHCYRTDGIFYPHVQFTDVEKKGLTESINAERAKVGLGPIVKFGNRPLTIAEVNNLIEQLHATAPLDEDDDE